MQATLTFNLDDPEDSRAHLRCVMAEKMAIALWELTHNLKSRAENIADVQEADSDIQDGVYITVQQVLEIIGDLPINDLIN